MPESPFKRVYRKSIKGLDTIQAVYAFIMALGLREVFLGSHAFLSEALPNQASMKTSTLLLSAFFFLNVLLLGIRFFWVPRNLRLLIYDAAEFDTSGASVNLPNWCLASHWLIILAHGALFFLVCLEFKFIMFTLTSNAAFGSTAFSGYFFGQVFLLIINGAWLYSVVYQRQRFARNRDVAVGPDRAWAWNNLSFALLAISPFLVLGTCLSQAAVCAVSYASEGIVQNLLPTSPSVITLAFSPLLDAVAHGWVAITGSDPTPGYVLSFWILGCFLVNSLVDLFSTARQYVVLEEVEWHEPDEKDSKFGQQERVPSDLQNGGKSA